MHVMGHSQTDFVMLDVIMTLNFEPPLPLNVTLKQCIDTKIKNNYHRPTPLLNVIMMLSVLKSVWKCPPLQPTLFITILVFGKQHSFQKHKQWLLTSNLHACARI